MTSEVIGAAWDEIEGEIWTVRKARMMGSREHGVPTGRQPHRQRGRRSGMTSHCAPQIAKATPYCRDAPAAVCVRDIGRQDREFERASREPSCSRKLTMKPGSSE
jgi:hypothetical protein